MSKAFTREDDDRPERPLARRQPSLLPPGAKNYLTPDGALRLIDARGVERASVTLHVGAGKLYLLAMAGGSSNPRRSNPRISSDQSIGP